MSWLASSAVLAARAVVRSIPKLFSQSLEDVVTYHENWWHWETRAKREPDPAKREEIYRRGVEELPDDAILATLFANFLAEVRQDYEQADALYRRTLEHAPNDASVAIFYAQFLRFHRTDIAAAERFYRDTPEIGPGFVASHAEFQHEVQRDFGRAEELYRRALRMDPACIEAQVAFANFLCTVREDFEEAERLYRKAYRTDPNNFNAIANFASFLAEPQRDCKESERLFRRALRIEPNNPELIANYGAFQLLCKKDLDKAEALYRKALALASPHGRERGAIAAFFQVHRKDYDEAERIYRETPDLDAEHLSGFATLMEDVRKDYDEAERLYRRALAKEPDNVAVIVRYAGFLWDVRKDYDEAERLDRKALELAPTDLWVSANHTQFLLRRGRFEEALTFSEGPWKLQQGGAGGGAALTAYLRALVLCVNGRDDAEALRRLKGLVPKGLDVLAGSFEEVHKAVSGALDEEDREFYKALGDVILEAQDGDELDRFERWRRS